MQVILEILERMSDFEETNKLSPRTYCPRAAYIRSSYGEQCLMKLQAIGAKRCELILALCAAGKSDLLE